jgi:hypothetical protein
MFSQKISSIILYILLAIAAVALILFFWLGVTPETANLKNKEFYFTDEALMLSYIFVAIAAILAVAFPIINIFSHPKGALGVVVALLVFVGVLALAYVFSSSETIPGLNLSGNVESTVKLVDAGLKACYIFGAVAFLGIIFTEIGGIFGK